MLTFRKLAPTKWMKVTLRIFIGMTFDIVVALHFVCLVWSTGFIEYSLDLS